MRRTSGLVAVFLLLVVSASARGDGVFLVDTGSPDGRMAMASRPPGPAIEIEPADDFLLSCGATVERATFFGLIPSNASVSDVSQVVVEVYRIFPLDSTNPPDGRVPTRANSPSDVALLSRDSAAANELSFTASVVNASFTAANSVLNGINAIPGQTTGGEGAVTGQEVQFDVTFTSTISLPAGHYFFVPQVALTSGNFFWLSAARPPSATDLQAWIRNADLAPDWLRVGTDIVGGASPPTFNGAFSLGGTTTPFPVTASAPSPLAVVLGAPIAPVTFSASGGTAPYTFAETGSLPGLSLDSSTGVLSGTPNAPGTYPISVTATDSLGCTGSVAFTIVAGAPSSVPTLGAGALAGFALLLAGVGVLALRR